MKDYKKKTPILGIPVVGKKDVIDPELEMQKWRGIENRLLVATGGARSRVFVEGAVVCRLSGDGTCRASLVGSGGSKALCGISNGRYIDKEDKLEWSGLKQGVVHFLYVATDPRTTKDPTLARPISTTRRKTGRRTPLLIATVDFKGARPIVNMKPSGKKYSEDETSSDPEARFVVMSAVLAGDKGVSVGFGAEVEFVDVTIERTINEVADAGQISVGYFGSDPSVKKSWECVVYNTGEAGINVRVMARCV